MLTNASIVPWHPGEGKDETGNDVGEIQLKNLNWNDSRRLFTGLCQMCTA